MLTTFYQHILALVFAVKQINENPQILPNATLGFHIYDSYTDAKLTYHATLKLLFMSHRLVINHDCETHKTPLAIIGAMDSKTSFQMADILNLYRIPQLSYGSVASAKSKMGQDPSFYGMATNEDPQYMGIISLLKHFRWTWVGLFVVYDDSGEIFLEIMESLLSQNGICTAFTQQIPNQEHFLYQKERDIVIHSLYQIYKSSTIKVFVLYGKAFTLTWLWYFISQKALRCDNNRWLGKVWITTTQTDFVLASISREKNLQMFQGALSFMVHSKKVPGFQEFLQTLKPDWRAADGFLKEFWEQAFDCGVLDSRMTYQVSGICTGLEKLETLISPLFEMCMSGHSYGIYNAVYAVAHGLHAFYSSCTNHRKMICGKEDFQPWQFHHFLQEISFNNSAGEHVSFNQNREVRAGFDIINLVTFPNRSFLKVKVGRIDPRAPQGKEFSIDDHSITWHQSFNQVLPISVCCDSCSPGYRKRKREGEKFCCYDCVSCPEGKISNHTNAIKCFRCPEDQYASRNQAECIYKLATFLSYEDPLGKCLASGALSLSVITVLVLGTFVKHNDTPIVKANNQKLTYTLLVSLLLCFLSSFLFIGQPGEVTCLLQQPFFESAFSVAVSSMLAKTITVIVAFLSTQPVSRMKNWVGKQMSTFLVFSCSLIQISICIIWLGTSPSFPDLDMNSTAGEITVQCNKGSAFMFYLAMGYMGLLSMITLIVAFLARKLPSTFNEAKFIIFSMLTFCSIWLSFIPSYLSTKGKNVVAVEIFSILASSASLLFCIFPAKCYIIVFRPELNIRGLLIKKVV